MNHSHSLSLAVIAALILLFAASVPAQAHCDSMDGPVIIEAQSALDKADITPILKWIKPDAEQEVLAAFNHALKVRKLGPEARELADSYFFETLVRVHRAGEGASYTGIKPAGQQEAIIIAADRALESGSSEALTGEVTHAIEAAIESRFQQARELKQHANHNVEAGREFVAAYVDYMHFVERIHNDAAASGHDHAEHAAETEHSHGSGHGE